MRRQKIAAAQGDDTDVLALVCRAAAGGRELVSCCAAGAWWTAAIFIGKNLIEFDPAEFLPSLLKQLYLDAEYLPQHHSRAHGFRGSRTAGRNSDANAPGIACRYLFPQRGPKHAFLELVEKNAKHSFDQRFRVLKPTSKAIAEALQGALNLPEAAAAYRKLRHFTHPGRGHGGVHGGVGRRPDEEIRLSQIHHSRHRGRG